MNMDTLLRQTLREWAEEAEVPQGLADRALRRRGRRRISRLSVGAGATALVTAGVLLAAQAVVTDSGSLPKEDTVSLPLSRPGMGGDDVRTDPGSSPPKKFVAAKQTALSAYYVTQSWGGSKLGPPDGFSRTWYLYDSTVGTYRKTPWAYLDVAPGLRLAAVLEGPLPASRVGIVDTAGGKVLRWVPLRPGAAGVAWSPDGDRLLVTHYTDNPDEHLEPNRAQPAWPGQDRLMASATPTSSGDGRTGYSVIDIRSAKAVFHRLPPEHNNINYRQDLGWSRDGRLIWSPTATEPSRVYYEIGGGRTEGEPTSFQEAGLSPNGRYLATNPVRRQMPNGKLSIEEIEEILKNEPTGPLTRVVETATGREVGTQPMLQLVAWADDAHLIGLGCGTATCRGKGEFHNRFVMVDIAGKEIVPLTGFRENSQEPGSWVPLFTRR
ncbi:hypothetical protein SAMN04489712_107313 [Thermomonospora echinospora]|uniref:WD40-like Beta Propeller Repeat n=1 Tax=Thermomonospora echinospora TaxID=1992 RepID=A0A1H6BPS0_9ACTN|nr:hypothetical protein [Thermomonospora echinospora]SEG62674.1 hypothetical protein SAMN04489712_107313 [Thermomonospora echinospora]